MLRHRKEKLIIFWALVCTLGIIHTNCFLVSFIPKIHSDLEMELKTDSPATHQSLCNYFLLNNQPFETWRLQRSHRTAYSVCDPIVWQVGPGSAEWFFQLLTGHIWPLLGFLIHTLSVSGLHWEGWDVWRFLPWGLSPFSRLVQASSRGSPRDPVAAKRENHNKTRAPQCSPLMGLAKASHRVRWQGGEVCS